MNWVERHVDSIVTAIVFGVVYWLSFVISKQLNLMPGFDKGTYLIFIPAGVKLVAALVGGLWGIVGVMAASIYLAHAVWPDQSEVFIFLNAAINGATTLMVVEFMRRKLKIDDDLSNLRLIHLPLIDLVNSSFHGLVRNGFWVIWGVESQSDFLSHASAMTVGDFTGSMVVLLGFAFLLKIKSKLLSARE